MDVLMIIYKQMGKDLELYKKPDQSYLLYKEDTVQVNLVNSISFSSLEEWFIKFKDQLGLDRWIEYAPKYIDSSICDFIRIKLSEHPYFIESMAGNTYTKAEKANDKEKLKEWLRTIQYCSYCQPSSSDELIKMALQLEK